jgi:hypothetical protein
MNRLPHVYLNQSSEGGDPGSSGGELNSQEAAEKEARIFGWRPAEEFDGPAERWKPADEFLEEGKRINGFLRKDLDKLRNELTKRDNTLLEMQQTIQQFAQFHQETEVRAFERAKKELKDARKAALRENDGDLVVEIEERLEQLGDTPPAAPMRQTSSGAPSQPDPVWAAWVSENKWFTENQKLRAITNGYADIVRAESSDLKGIQFLEEVKRRVQEDFPEHFRSEGSRRPNAVGGSGESRQGVGKKSFADLPADAKEACDKFVKQKLIPSREAYVRDYFGEAA